jgi:hypothetical protein
MTYTAEDVQKMDIPEICDLIKKKTGRPVDSSTGVWLAMAHGAARAGGSLLTIDLNKGENSHGTPNYEGLAEMFNKPDIPQETRPEFTVYIPRPDHFLENYEIARKASPEALRKFVDDIFGLLLWGMREYRQSLSIYPDFCKNSFYWTFSSKDNEGYLRVVFNGGYINHGTEEKPDWSIHT